MSTTQLLESPAPLYPRQRVLLHHSLCSRWRYNHHDFLTFWRVFTFYNHHFLNFYNHHFLTLLRVLNSRISARHVLFLHFLDRIWRHPCSVWETLDLEKSFEFLLTTLYWKLGLWQYGSFGKPTKINDATLARWKRLNVHGKPKRIKTSIRRVMLGVTTMLNFFTTSNK